MSNLIKGRMQIVVVILIILSALSVIYLAIPRAAPVDTGDIPAGKLRSAWESIKILLKEEDARLLVSVPGHINTLARLVPAIAKDEIACVVPTPEELKKLESKTRVILPEAGAFSMPSRRGTVMGDVVLGQDVLIRQQNPLLQIVKEKHTLVTALLKKVELQMDQRGDRMKSRFIKRSSMLTEAIGQLKTDVVAACVRQKTRLAQTHPQLSNYQFIDESVVDTVSPLGSYVNGTNVIGMQGTQHNQYAPLTATNARG